VKVVALISDCKECPNRHYYSGGRYECMKAQSVLPYERAGIPEWCPLTNYPAAAMTQLQDEVRVLRQQVATQVASDV